MADEKDIAIPFFHNVACEDPTATKANGGVPVYVDVPCVEIRIPGSKDRVVRPIEPNDKSRWPRQWEAFEKQEKQQLDGIPISEWANGTEAERKNVLQLGIQTVEQLAGLADNHAQNLRIQKYKQKAQAFLDSRNGAAEVGKIQQEVKELKRLVKKLEKENAELTNAANNDLPERDESNRVHSP